MKVHRPTIRRCRRRAAYIYFSVRPLSASGLAYSSPSLFVARLPRSPVERFPSVRHSGFGGAHKGNPMSVPKLSPFSLLGLDSSLLDTLARLGYTEPTPVQRAAIPAVLAGGDLLVSSQTGSGKTAAFVLPGLQRLRAPSALPATARACWCSRPRASSRCRCRRRRTATAAASASAPRASWAACRSASSSARCESTSTSSSPPPAASRTTWTGQRRAPPRRAPGARRSRPHARHGLPGRARLHPRARPENRQTLLFSATLDGVVGRLAERVMRDAKRIEIAPREEARLDITQQRPHRRQRRAQEPPARLPAAPDRRRAGARLHRHEAHRPSSRARSSSRASPPARCTATCSSASAPTR